MKIEVNNKSYIFALILISLFLYINNVSAQSTQVSYFYDNNGNRTSSGYTIFAPHRQIKDSTKNDSDKIIATTYGVNVYPNPTTGQVNVAIKNLQNCGEALVNLMDASGNEISIQEVTSSPVPVNLAGFKQGIYYIKVTLCNEQLYYKVVKLSEGTSKGLPAAMEK